MPVKFFSNHFHKIISQIGYKYNNLKKSEFFVKSGNFPKNIQISGQIDLKFAIFIIEFSIFGLPSPSIFN